jgi:uncharacterized membrane-anchored protein
MKSPSRAFLASAVFALVAGTALAQDAPEQTLQTKKEAAFQAAAQAAQAAAISGPKDVPVAAQAVLHLPAGYIFIPQPEAGQLSLALGNNNSPRLIGIATAAESGGWLAYLDYIGDGHVKDDDAKTWNADELLQSLKDGTDSANEDRINRGFSALEVGGWVEAPAYDAASHRLVWSALVKQKGSTDGGSANYNTYALGRDGHFELNLVTGIDKVEAQKVHAKELLASLQFNEGKRYEDFDPKTDRLAEYGLAALIGGVAAKKLGVLAIAAAFAAKFFKLIAIGAIALVAGLRSLFKRRGDSGQA